MVNVLINGGPRPPHQIFLSLYHTEPQDHLIFTSSLPAAKRFDQVATTGRAVECRHHNIRMLLSRRVLLSKAQPHSPRYSIQPSSPCSRHSRFTEGREAWSWQSVSSAIIPDILRQPSIPSTSKETYKSWKYIIRGHEGTEIP